MISLLLLTLTATPEGASAVQLPSKAAVFVQGPQEAALTRALKDEGTPLLDLNETFPAAPADTQGAKLVSEAKQAYDDLDYDASISKWNEALEYYIQHPSAVDAAGLGNIHFYLGALAIQNGGKAQSKKGTEEFVRALRFNPSLVCDPAVYGADVKTAFDKALEELASKGKVKLAINSSPEGAAVQLQGKNVGTTPVADAPEVAPGRHLLSFSKPGYEPTGLFADVDAAGGQANAQLKATAGHTAAREAAENLLSEAAGKRATLPESATTLATRLKTRFLVLGEAGKAEVWDVETGNRITGLSLEGDALTGSAKQIAQFIANPRPAEVAGAGAAGDGEPIYTKWWFWTAVGVVVAGGAAAAGIAVAESPRPFNIVLGAP